MAKADLTPPPIATQPDRGASDHSERARAWHARSSLAVGGIVAATNLLECTHRSVPFVGPALGFAFLVLIPVYLLYTSALWQRCAPAERLGYSVTAVLLALMLAGLAANTLLPYAGVPRPLAPTPVLILGDALVTSLYLLRLRWPAQLSGPRPITRPGRAEIRVLTGSALCVALAILGANRLNNGAGDQVSLAALAVSVVTLVLLLFSWRRVREGVTCAALYLNSLGLLLMTSLRGWFVTGHDIQTEFQVFQLTQTHARWDIAAFHNTYNACLSITMLPTELGEMLRVDDPYVYKLFFQLIFAVCPVLVYVIARRHWQVPVSILAAIYFISFPTFFADMPFLNRQEIGLLFVCAGILAITNAAWSPRQRRLTFIVACLGVEVSHYSSMYVLLGIVSAAWIAQHVARLRPRSRRRRPVHASTARWTTVTRTVGAGSILAVAAITFSWGSLATQTAGTLVTDTTAAITSFFGHGAGARSGSVADSLLFAKTPSRQALLEKYAQQAIKARTGQPSGAYMPSAVVSAQPLKVIEPMLPLTAAGRLLARAGVPVVGLNTVMRLAAAEAEQVFVGTGLITLLAVPALRRRVSREFFYLSLASTFMLAVVTILPNLSVDYGILRVFQEALILIGPVLVMGSITIFRPLGKVWAPRVAAAVGVVIYVSTSGLLPQVLGGYIAQLSLNNSGPYYYAYYTHPQESVAETWLSYQRGTLPSGMQATFSQSRFLFTAPPGVTEHQFITDAFPLLVRPRTWIVMDYSVLHGGLAAMSYSGDLIFYHYPTGFLLANRNLVYDNGGAEIYR